MKNIMNKSNIKGKNDRRDVNSEWFTGKTWMKVLSEKIKSKDQDIYHVHFESDFKIKKTERISLNEGDIVHIPAKTLHTHGSIDKNKEFSHIAINILPKKNSIYKTIWYESDFKNKVTKII